MANLEESIYLLKHLGEVNLMGRKNKIRNSYIKILYQIHLYQKNVNRGAWNSIFPSRDMIAEHAGLSVFSITAFVNSHAFSIFGEKIERPGTSNVYKLHGWVHELFNAFERVGMMRGFAQNFSAWRRYFLKRLNGAFLPLVQKGHSLMEVVNKLCTKFNVKSIAQKLVKSIATTGSSNRSTTPSGSKSKQEVPLSLQKAAALDRALGSRFFIKEADRIMLFRNFSLNKLSKAAALRELWAKRGMEAKSPLYTFLGCLKRVTA